MLTSYADDRGTDEGFHKKKKRNQKVASKNGSVFTN